MKKAKQAWLIFLALFCLHNAGVRADRQPVLQVKSDSHSKGAVRNDSRSTNSFSRTIRSNATVGSLDSNKVEALARRQPGYVRIGAEAKGFAQLRPPASEDTTAAASQARFNAYARVVANSALGNITFPLRLRLNGTMQVKYPTSPPPDRPLRAGEIDARMHTALSLNGIPNDAGSGTATLDAVNGLSISSINISFRAAFGTPVTTAETIADIPMTVVTVPVSGTITIPIAVNVSQRGLDAAGNQVFTSGSIPFFFEAGVQIHYHNFQSGATADFLDTGEMDADPSAPAGASLVVEDAATAIFPHLATGGNVASVTLLATNSHDTATEVRLRTFRPTGTPLSLTFASGETGSDIRFTVPARSTVALTTVRSEPSSLTAGWIQLDSALELTTVQVFSIFSGGALFTEAGVLNSPARNEMHVPVDTRGDSNMGIAFANPLSTAVTLTLTLFDKSGAKTSEVPFSLAAGNQVARFLTEFFSGVSGIDEFLGSVSIKVSGESEIPAVALRQQGLIITVIPVADGPLV
ncbi:MAG: hypothetical protein HY645_03730 [Acidobacteria bacterium]|nr:hypothetical protein [Acidobacteriota bacterium]